MVQEVTQMAAVDVMDITSNAGIEREAGGAAGGSMS